jgi:hypothetical protein
MAVLLEMFTCASDVTVTLIEYRGFNSFHSRVVVHSALDILEDEFDIVIIIK